MSVLLLCHVMYGCPQPKKLFSSLIVFVVWAMPGSPSVLAQAQETSVDEVRLRSDTDVATAGYFQLNWDAEQAVRLYESTTADFEAARVVYEGNDSGHTVSGRADGELFFRLESAATGETLGRILRVEVAHHPLARALTFFAIGAIVFLATLLLVVKGSVNARPAAGNRQ
ncbi:MAG: hypothetical protein PVF50_07905 [Gammaproteobacteria bacterium]